MAVSEERNPQQLIALQLAQMTQLETLLTNEYDILQQQDPDALIDITQQKNELLTAIQTIDNTIEHSFEFKQQKQAGMFSSELAEIEQLLINCKAQNQTNGMIIQQSQLSVERMKNSLLETHNKTAMTYDNKGKKSSGLSSLNIKA